MNRSFNPLSPPLPKREPKPSKGLKTCPCCQREVSVGRDTCPYCNYYIRGKINPRVLHMVPENETPHPVNPTSEDGPWDGDSIWT